MRVIGGRFRSRKLASVPGLAVRPTPDRLRETLFNILAPRIDGCTFVDAYAGSGAVGLEALSRGAAHVVLIEKSAQAVAVIRENVAALGAEGEVTVVRGNATMLAAEHAADIVFIDPPYEHRKAYVESITSLGLTECPLVIAQHASRMVLAEQFEKLRRVRSVKQGDNMLSFYEREATASSG